jgi:hypothetical protein
MRRAAITAATRRPPTEPQDHTDEDPEADDAPAQRIEQQTLWVDLQVQAAMRRGEFDNLPGTGKPLRLPDRHDPDWWVKGLIERERITGVLPPALALRKEDAQLDGELDRLASEAEVRRTVADFNRRVVEARRQLQGGPPVVTPTRDAEQEVAAWRERWGRRRARAEQLTSPPPPRRRWWRRRSEHR